jgi:hypothetical protein
LEAEHSEALANTDHKIEKLERLLENFDTIFESPEFATKGIKFNYLNNRPRTEKEQEMFGNSPNYWTIKSKEDVAALIDLIQADKKSLQQGALTTPIDFPYTRDKSKAEIAQYGNQWYPDTGEDIWKLSRRQDIERLITILNSDKTKAKAKFQFTPVDFSYGDTKDRPKAAEEISDYGDLVYHDQNEHHWAIQSRAAIDKLIALIKAEQANLQANPIHKTINFKYATSKNHKKTAEEKETFGSNQHKDGELNWAIKDRTHAEQMNEIMRTDIRKRQEEAQVIAKRMSDIRLQSDGEALSGGQIIRGIPTRNATLHDFNIEAMLRTASKLASTTSAFNVTEENCSTTSMKLLQAGAPEAMRHMFQWTRNTAENPASNAFLTNPQAVYSAATLVAKAQSGDKEAIGRVKAEAFLIPNTNYYIRINKLLAYKDDKAQLLNTIKTNFFSYLRISPKLICDLWITTDTKHAPKDEQEIDKYLNRLNDAVRTQGHSVIKHENPLLAIQHMKEQLQEDPKAVPFFDEKTLQVVRNYILTIESKEEQTKEDIQLLKEYSSIINERDERLSCVELAVMGNKDPGTHLLSRTDKSTALTWAQIPSSQAEIMVAKFCEEYKKIQAPKYFQIFRSNFLNSLPQHASNEEKLKIIQKHITEKPSSASAQAWSNCTFNKETLDLVSTHDASPTTHELPKDKEPVQVTDTREKSISFRDRYQSSASAAKEPEKVEEETSRVRVIIESGV